MNRQLELLKDCEVPYSQALLQMKQIEKQKNEWEEIQKQKRKAEEKERLEISEQLLHESQPKGRGRQDGCHHWTG